MLTKSEQKRSVLNNTQLFVQTATKTIIYSKKLLEKLKNTNTVTHTFDGPKANKIVSAITFNFDFSENFHSVQWRKYNI